MNPEKIIVIDDLPIKIPISNVLVKDQYKKVNIVRILKLEDIKKNMVVPRDTVVFINAHVKFENSDLRIDFKGIDFLINQFRTYWGRKEGVIIYSSLRLDSFLSMPIVKWLIKDKPCCRYHKYFRIPNELDKIPELIKEVEIIPNEELEICSIWKSIIRFKMKKWLNHDIPRDLKKNRIEHKHIEKTKALYNELLSVPLSIQNKIGIQNIFDIYDRLESNPQETINRISKLVKNILEKGLLERR